MKFFGKSFFLCIIVPFVSNNNNNNEIKIISSMILKELSKLLPHSLICYLDLCLEINSDDLKFFFEDCNNNQVKLKKLLIRDGCRDSFTYSNDYCFTFDKKDLKFLAYINLAADYHYKEETQTLIKMVKHEDLVIKVSDIDGNLMIR